MTSVVRFGKEHERYLVALVTIVVLVVRWGWVCLVTVPLLVLMFVLDQRHVDDDVACGKCFHRKDDHAGNCQECLRQQVRGELARDVPCSRFGRTVVTRRASAQSTRQR